MRVIKVQNKSEGALFVAKTFIEESSKKPYMPVGLATGSTMLEVYGKLAELGFKPLFSHAFALDEYVGLGVDHPNSYAHYLLEHFAKPLGYGGKIHVPGQGEYSSENGPELFETAIRTHGPLSVQLLGLGPNGHLAFNEPGSALDSRTRVVSLASETIVANRQYFDPPEAIPELAVTQGLATIAQADSLLVAVFGPEKQAALTKALNPEFPDTPFSAIRDHPNLTLVTDLKI